MLVVIRARRRRPRVRINCYYDVSPRLRYKKNVLTFRRYADTVRFYRHPNIVLCTRTGARGYFAVRCCLSFISGPLSPPARLRLPVVPAPPCTRSRRWRVPLRDLFFVVLLSKTVLIVCDITATRLWVRYRFRFVRSEGRLGVGHDFGKYICRGQLPSERRWLSRPPA